jgi:ABC transport system ATP-binding/permease protein
LVRPRLSYKERRELQDLPARIELLEQEQSRLHEEMADAGYHRRGAAQVHKDRTRLDQIEIELTQCFARWSELEARDAMDGSL